MLQCAYLRKIPFVLPRRSCFGEHINDHQMETLHQFTQLELAVEVQFPLLDSFFSDLSEAFAQPTGSERSFIRQQTISGSSVNLLSSLKATISSILDS